MSVAFHLTADAALSLEVDRELAEIARAWMPLSAVPVSNALESAVRIRVQSGHVPLVVDATPPMLRLGGVDARMNGRSVVTLRGQSRMYGRIALDERVASITVEDSLLDASTVAPLGLSRAGGEAYSMLTLSSAFLLGRLARALVHAAAVVDPSGRAWLLAGDTHAGKTTTCVSLVDAGWSFLADDQVVLRRVEGRIEVEGWPRLAHLDEGWSAGAVTGQRGAVNLRERWGDRWRATAPLGGVLLPSVMADQQTRTSPAHAATAFAALVRQSPWLMGDAAAAPAIMRLLQATASRPAFALALGLDSYANGALLADRLDDAVRSASRTPAFAPRDRQ